MCCLFGILDYDHFLTTSQKNHILSVLSTACEARGTDATGIAYNTRGGLKIFKRPLPAHRMRMRVPAHTNYIMGHTRLSTQGSERINRNNHPFYGAVRGASFALAHNGVLLNDRELQKRLPVTKIETDSYVAVQLIERMGELSFASLKQVAEQVEGTFSFTILDNRDNLYLIKGNNPLCLYHWPRWGVYLYASTEDILKKALKKIQIKLGIAEKVDLDAGDILRIDRYGRITRSCFDVSHLYNNCVYSWPGQFSFLNRDTKADSDAYISDLKSVAQAFGYSPEDIDLLLQEGFLPEEIEECFYSGEL